MPDIRPCPFCGGEGSVCFGGNRQNKDDWYGFIHVECSSCKAQGSGFYYHGKAIRNVLKQEPSLSFRAIAAWNSRYSDYIEDD